MTQDIRWPQRFQNFDREKTILDTDILSDFLRGKNVNVVRREDAYLHEHGRITISVITAFEIVRGRHQAQP